MKLNNKTTLTIGITAYNEGQNLPRLIKSLQSQKCNLFDLSQILIISDGSTDNTVKLIMDSKNSTVTLIIKSERLGKAARINEIFAISKSEILVLLDADILIKNTHLLETLVKPFYEDADLLCISGSIKPLTPKNFTQKVIYAGSKLWENVRKDSDENVDMYNCSGAIRAFRKKLYKKMIFPSISAEDVYPYFYCASKNLKFKVVPKAVVFYKIPEKYGDFFKQMSRYMKSKKILSQYFNSEFIESEFSISIGSKLKMLFFELISNPFWVSFYILYLLPIHIHKIIKSNDSDRPAWDVAITSKNTI